MNILDTLKKQNSQKAVIRASAFALAVLIVSFLTALVNSFLCDPIAVFSRSAWILSAGFIFSVITYLLFKQSSSKILSDTARNLDSMHHGKNRLEAAVELQESDNPLKSSQLNETENYFKEKKIDNFLWLILLILFFIFSILI